VQLPEVRETMNKSFIEEAALSELPGDEEALEDLPVDEAAKEDPRKGQEAMKDLPIDEAAKEDPQEDEEAMEDLPMDEVDEEDLPMDEEDKEDPQEDKEVREELPVEKKEKETSTAKWRRPRGWLQRLALVAMFCLARQERMVMGFIAYDCANGTNRVDAYSLLEPAACPPRRSTTRWNIPSSDRSCK
jgi:hypothetical protein